MMRYTIIALIVVISTIAANAQKLDNMFYAFNNCVRTLPNAPKGMDNQAKAIKKLGYKGFAGHHSEDYFERRAALDNAGIEMPEIYLPLTIEEDGTVSYFDGLKEIIKDSKDRNLVVALTASSKTFTNNKTEGDKHLVKALQELADFAAPYNVKIAVYPHVNFYCEQLDHSIRICKAVNRPNVGAIFNTCHLFKVEGMENWEQKLIEAIPYLYMISINGLDRGDTKSYEWDKLIQPLGEGSFDTYEIVKIAKNNGYDGIFGLQCYNIDQDFEVAMKKSMHTWKEYQKRYKREK